MYRAQALSYDFLIASIIFSLILSIVFLHWHYTAREIRETRISHDAVNKIFIASQVFFRTGVPIYWNPDNVIELGLENENVLNSTKLNHLNELDYEKVINLLVLHPYKLYYKISSENGTMLFEFGEYPANAKNILKSRRFSVLNQTLVTIEILVWL